MCLLAWAWLLAQSLSAQSLSTQSPDPLLVWLDRQAQQLLDRRDHALAAIGTAADAERRRAMVRSRLLESLGGLPDHRGPLRARVTGRLQGEGYTIEKVIFESLPGFYVTGNLYLPKQKGRYPGVLVPAGHTQEGKAETQVVCANLARNGFVALTYDPIAQGEREQTYLPQLGRPLSGGAGNEHLELGARSLLIGQSVARYFLFDGMRAIDYLSSRPEVDPERIGVTGCSGGGAITTYVAAFDPRVKAAAPGCYISTYRTLFTGPTPDSEMALPRLLANGFDTADLFEVAAPLPWLMMATSEDYFTPASARPVYEETLRWYRLFGAEDRIRYFVGQGPHGTPKESREEIYRWMTRWLKDGQGEPRDEPVRQFANHNLLVTASGNVDGEPGSRKLYQVILDEFRKQRQPRSQADLRAELQRWGVPRTGSAPSATTVSQQAQGTYRIDQIQFESEPGITIQGRLYLPRTTARNPGVVIVEDKRLPVPLYVQRSPSTNPLAEKMVSAGAVVLEVDVRDSPGAIDGRPFLGNWLTNERADLVGRNLPALRAHDILAAVHLLAARPDVDPVSIRGYARGVKGFWLLLAAAVDARLGRLWLDRTPWSFQSAFEAPLTSFLFDATIPGFARHWDFRDLVQSLGKRPVLWTDPVNWMNRVVFPGGPYRYRHVGEGDDALVREFLQ